MNDMNRRLWKMAAGIAAAIAFAALPARAGDPSYTGYAASAGLGASAGEPSIGVDERTGAVMYIASLQTLKVTFDDSTTPATAAWQDVSHPLTSFITLDPILYTDQKLGRTFVSQLL